ncbi:hypothetical protein [Actinoplanes regularis]|uniref:Uncharacterized protein n=1 Tax=Actinoplanes regularis TaxID=52697 RepID=A0A238V4H9_9ACTN|nr:hypothetical protein [Actinoplanes regularis]GIE83901.1 hypothetical protein Are01nite_03810 [Actinoplanes regularis]GLW29798.1 hypothetical protein Areg01_27380 [Actinoplanes regularis]SNR29402.1 hypothetical protein SAMN06264365_101690 [Actinoplanes regularis]
MTGLWDAERDAGEVVQALIGLAALLGRGPESAPPDTETLQIMRRLVDNGASSATRVQGFLQDRRGAGDGDAVAVSPVLAPWREWVPSRGHLFGAGHAPRAHGARRINEVPQPRRCDPGE